ncbi:hypothetical protein C7974DRAFT_455104 [Boeremia exigua]|uniref:uncharacterized protein n=1 Tax=Boeremia exigua TaxID=749465 RepID=UPI001E8CE91B|nr:uncharacterized protein C7974DRAFT_455104 [Boeremia exigua]KAH6625192.1 hypothetical protein C7974DRAFT_455104 [Boeremia exigua]
MSPPSFWFGLWIGMCLISYTGSMWSYPVYAIFIVYAITLYLKVRRIMLHGKAIRKTKELARAVYPDYTMSDVVFLKAGMHSPYPGSHHWFAGISALDAPAEDCMLVKMRTPAPSKGEALVELQQFLERELRAARPKRKN